MRTRRSARDIAFSFDSFLDVVANVIGIILRLILVAWVGAQSYQAIVPAPAPPTPTPATAGPSPEPGPDLASLHSTLDTRREALAGLEARWRDRQSRAEHSEKRTTRTEQSLAALRAERAEVEKQLATAPPVVPSEPTPLVVEKRALQTRRETLAEQLRATSATGPAPKVLRYRTPVSRTLQSEEMMFELRGGRVTPIDLAVLMQEVRRGMNDARERLKTFWEVKGVTRQVGAFRMRYVIVRQRGLLDGPGSIGPDSESSFRYGLDSWKLEPLEEPRGESADTALAPGSGFRKLTDGIQPDLTAVTFWVYPDSFPAYRRLRDHLHARGVEVAGRPLPADASISASRKGSASRGQ